MRKRRFRFRTDGRAFCTLEDLAQCRGVCDFHLLIRRLLEEGQEADRLVEAAEKIRNLYCDNELGYGVVPVDAFDRLWREKTGRICTELCRKAEGSTPHSGANRMVIKSDKDSIDPTWETYGNTFGRYIGVTDEPL